MRVAKPDNLHWKPDYISIIPLKINRLEPWKYDRVMCKKCNETEKLFGKFKGFRRIFSRFKKSDIIFLSLSIFPLLSKYLDSVNRHWFIRLDSVNESQCQRNISKGGE